MYTCSQRIVSPLDVAHTSLCLQCHKDVFYKIVTLLHFSYDSDTLNTQNKADIHKKSAHHNVKITTLYLHNDPTQHA